MPAAILVALTAAACVPRPAPDLTIAVASSLAPMLPALTEALRDESDLQVTHVLGASVDLAEQIRSGAPMDVFLAADPVLLESLHEDGLLESEPVVFASGDLSLVLSDEARSLGEPTLDILLSPEVRTVVIADPEHAPFGTAARQALQSAGLWESVRDRLVYAGSARQALEVVETGNAQVGLVPASLLSDSALAAARIPSHLYTPPRYAAGVLSSSAHIEQALEFLEILRSERGRLILLAGGLTPANTP